MISTLRQLFSLLSTLTGWGRFNVWAIVFILGILLTSSLAKAPHPPKSELTVADTSDPVDQLIEQALRLRGTPYVYGGKTPAGFDCSGYARYVYQQVGVTLPGSSRAQFTSGTPISLDNAQRGDLVFFSIYGDRINHVGILLDTVSGNTPFVHATSSRGVRIDQLEDTYYASRLVGARTVLSE
ncbi:MAG: C40 family peptidase [Tunicatimonas sp.]